MAMLGLWRPFSNPPQLYLETGNVKEVKQFDWQLAQ